MTKQAILDNKKVDKVMKNFKADPYETVLRRLNNATKETIKHVSKKESKDE